MLALLYLLAGLKEADLTRSRFSLHFLWLAQVIDLKRLRASHGWKGNTIYESEMALSSECRCGVLEMGLTPPTLSEKRCVTPTMASTG
jgi:hypothetical protein